MEQHLLQFGDLVIDEDRYLECWRNDPEYARRTRDDLLICSPRQFFLLPEDQRRIVRDWIEANVRPAPPSRWRVVSQWLRNMMQEDTGLYVNHSAMRGALLHAGYRPKDIYTSSWSSLDAKVRPDHPRACEWGLSYEQIYKRRSMLALREWNKECRALRAAARVQHIACAAA